MGGPGSGGQNAIAPRPIHEVLQIEPGSPAYQHVHKWMRRTFPRVGRCEWCAQRKRTDYAIARRDGYTYNRADWLELCARCHNWFDGRSGPGEKNGRAKLTDDQVREMRQLRERGWTVVALGERYGVSHVLASRICRRKAWRHVA